MASAAEAQVRASEEALEAARDPTERDVRETRLREDLEFADQVHGIVAAERERLPEPWLLRQALWREWQTVRNLRRARMTPRQKAYVMNTFGMQLYRSLKW